MDAWVLGLLHNLTTPLAAVKWNASGIKDYLPSLIHAYEQALKHGLVPETIRSQHLSLLANALNHIEESADNAMDQINTIMQQR